MNVSDSELKKLLLASGAVGDSAIAEAEKIHKQTKEPLVQTVVKRKLISEKDLTKLYGASIKVPFVDLNGVKISRDVLTKIPERIARKYQAVLFGKKDKSWLLALADPEDIQAVDFIEKQVGSDVLLHIATPADILGALDQYKGSLDTEITKAIKDSADEEEDATPEVSAKELAEDAPIAKTVNIIIEYAVKSRASDIHIEPREGIVQVRYRIDGVLRESMTLPRPILLAVVSRIKILANLKIDEHRIPQDGRFKFSLGSKTVALRVSTLPIMDGEKVVMRLLDESTRALTLEELGFDGRSLDVIKRNLTKPHGMTLVTGPTGSGKSTTLYSVLSVLNSPSVNISTVEDPVEYKIVGVNQTQVNPKAGMTFASGLRALLRQDPNIIMVGEIRDKETAGLAVQAALTGHIVLSTLHTNNAATTLPRLLDMSIEPFLIASTVNTVIGQRLVRKLCGKCRVSYVPDGKALEDIRKDFHVDEALAHINEDKAASSTPIAQTAPAPAPAATTETEISKHSTKVLEPSGEIDTTKASILNKIASDPNILNRSAEDAKKTAVAVDAMQAATSPDATTTLQEGQFMLYKGGAGCDECSHTGYQGRMGIYEVLEVDEIIGKMIVNHSTSDELQLAAVKAGMITMQQDGFIKALRGLTSIEEILRVTKE